MVQRSQRSNTNGSQATLGRMETTLAAMGEMFVGFRTELATIKLEQANQKEQIRGIEVDWKTGFDGVNQSISRIVSKIEERDKPKTASWIAGFSAMFLVTTSVTGVAVFFVQSSIREAVMPMTQNISSLQQLTSNFHDTENKAILSREADQRSETDRNEINRRLSVIENAQATNLATSRQTFAELKAGFTENETQFKNLVGMVYYLWAEVFGKAYPVIPRETPGAR